MRNGDITATLSIAKPAGGNLEITGTGIYRINPGLVANANFAPDRDWDLSVTQSFDAAVLQAIYNTDTNLGTIGFGINDSLLIGSTNVLYNLSTLVDTDGNFEAGGSLQAAGDGLSITMSATETGTEGKIVADNNSGFTATLEGRSVDDTMLATLEHEITPNIEVTITAKRQANVQTIGVDATYTTGNSTLTAGVEGGPDVNTSGRLAYQVSASNPVYDVDASLSLQANSSGQKTLSGTASASGINVPGVGLGTVGIAFDIHDERDDFMGIKSSQSLFVFLLLQF